MSQDIVTSNKEILIRALLANSVYQPDSGLVQEVTKGLMKLSVSQLSNLKLLIGIKIDDGK